MIIYHQRNRFKGGVSRKVRDDRILEKISTPDEMSGLLNEALDGLDRLKNNKDFSYSSGTASVKDFWIRSSDSFRAFCMDMIVQDFEQYISKKNLRRQFNGYCKEHGIKGCSDKNIKVVLEDMFGVIEMKHGNNFERVWEGIRFKSKKEQTEPNRQGRHYVTKTLEKTNSSVFQNPLPTLPINPKKTKIPPKSPEILLKEEKPTEKPKEITPIESYKRSGAKSLQECSTKATQMQEAYYECITNYSLELLKPQKEVIKRFIELWNK